MREKRRKRERERGGGGQFKQGERRKMQVRKKEGMQKERKKFR